MGKRFCYTCSISVTPSYSEESGYAGVCPSCGTEMPCGQPSQIEINKVADENGAEVYDVNPTPKSALYR